jgi:hypothetical protein
MISQKSAYYEIECHSMLMLNRRKQCKRKVYGHEDDEKVPTLKAEVAKINPDIFMSTQEKRGLFHQM